MVFLRGIAPHIFQFIKAAVFGQHHVDHNIHIIDQNPLIVLSAFMFIGKFITVFPDLFFYGVGDRLYLGGAGCFTDNKEICYCFRDLSEVQGDDIFAFFFLYCFNDCFKDFRTPR